MTRLLLVSPSRDFQFKWLLHTDLKRFSQDHSVFRELLLRASCTFTLVTVPRTDWWMAAVPSQPCPGIPVGCDHQMIWLSGQLKSFLFLFFLGDNQLIIKHCIYLYAFHSNTHTHHLELGAFLHKQTHTHTNIKQMHISEWHIQNI